MYVLDFCAHIAAKNLIEDFKCIVEVTLVELRCDLAPMGLLHE